MTNKTPEFSFRDDDAKALWEQGVRNNSDPYGSCVYRYAAKWAALMEDELSKGKTVYEIASETSHKADADEGITGFMYGCAVSILSQAWKYGEELRQWHNLDVQIGKEGEEANKKGTVLNPALLNIG